MEKLVVAYNGKSGTINGFMQSVHKWVSPDTYECNLCMLTHGFNGAKEMWSEALEEWGGAIVIFHSNDLPSDYRAFELPFIGLEAKAGFKLILSASELNQFSSLNILLKELKIKLYERN